MGIAHCEHSFFANVPTRYAFIFPIDCYRAIFNGKWNIYKKISHSTTRENTVEAKKAAPDFPDAASSIAFLCCFYFIATLRLSSPFTTM